MQTGQNVKVRRGDDFKLQVTVNEDGTAKDVTGTTWLWRLRVSRRGGILATKTNGDGVTLVTPASGRGDIEGGSEVTDRKLGSYFQEVLVTDINAKTVSVLEGRFTIN